MLTTEFLILNGSSVPPLTVDGSELWWRMIYVANIVQTPISTKKGMPVIPSKTELIPANSSPQTTGCGKGI